MVTKKAGAHLKTLLILTSYVELQGLSEAYCTMLTLSHLGNRKLS